jgi:hypothetical protein
MSNLKTQISGLHDDLKVAVQKDPKAIAGTSTHTLLMNLANQALNEVKEVEGQKVRGGCSDRIAYSPRRIYCD